MENKFITISGKPYSLDAAVPVRGDTWYAIRGPRGGSYLLIGKNGKWLLCNGRTVETIAQYEAADVLFA